MKSKDYIQQNESDCIPQDVLLLYIQGKLAGGDMAQIESHLANCSMCSDELEGLMLLENPSDVKRITKGLNKKIDKFNYHQKPKIFSLNYMVRVAATLAVFVGISTLVYYFLESSKPNLTLSEELSQKSSDENKGLIAEKIAEEIAEPESLAIEVPTTNQESMEEAPVITIVEDDIDLDNQEEVFALGATADDNSMDTTEFGEALVQPAPASSTSPLADAAVGAKSEESKDVSAGGIFARQSKKTSSINYATVDSESVENQKTIEIDFFAEEEEVEEEEIYMMVEQMPVFMDENGDDFSVYIMKNRRYPPEAIENGIQGKVYIEFCVEADGSVSNVTVVKGVDPLLDKEAVRLVESSPKWKPGMQRGKPVKVKMAFPVNFEIY